MYSCSWNTISQLQSVTCHMRSHSVTCHPTQVNTPRLNPSQTGQYSISVQNAVARLVTGTRRSEHITPVLRSLHWLPVRQLIVYKLATLIRKCLIGRAPAYLAEYCHKASIRRPGTRSADTSMLEVPRTRTALGDRSFAIAGPRIWNNLPPSIRDLTLSAGTFATLPKIYLFV